MFTPVTLCCRRLDYTDEQATEKYGERRCPFGDGAHNPCGSRLPSADLGPAPDLEVQPLDLQPR